jgi:di/tripeptidase
MREVHTIREFVRLEDMIRATELLVAIIRQHSEA